MTSGLNTRGFLGGETVYDLGSVGPPCFCGLCLLTLVSLSSDPRLQESFLFLGKDTSFGAVRRLLVVSCADALLKRAVADPLSVAIVVAPVSQLEALLLREFGGRVSHVNEEIAVLSRVEMSRSVAGSLVAVRRGVPHDVYARVATGRCVSARLDVQVQVAAGGRSALVQPFGLLQKS